MKKCALFCCFIFYSVAAYSQPGISDGAFNQATSSLKQDYNAFSDLIYVLAGLIATVGAIRVYHKWQMGEEIVKDLSGWFFACLFVIVANLFISALFAL